MAGELAHTAKVVGGGHEALTEMPEPHAVDDRAPRERVVLARDPFGKCGAPGGLGMVGGQIKFKIFLFKNWQRAGANGIAWVGSATVANEDAYLITKTMRAMGLTYIDHQARI